MMVLDKIFYSLKYFEFVSIILFFIGFMYKIFLYQFFFNLEESGPELSHMKFFQTQLFQEWRHTTVCNNGEREKVSKRLWNEVS